MANVLANRLQHLIGKCVYIAQSAFVPGRLITDNVLLGYELLDTFRKKTIQEERIVSHQVGYEQSL